MLTREITDNQGRKVILRGKEADPMLYDFLQRINCDSESEGEEVRKIRKI